MHNCPFLPASLFPYIKNFVPNSQLPHLIQSKSISWLSSFTDFFVPTLRILYQLSLTSFNLIQISQLVAFAGLKQLWLLLFRNMNQFHFNPFEHFMFDCVMIFKVKFELGFKTPKLWHFLITVDTDTSLHISKSKIFILALKPAINKSHYKYYPCFVEPKG